MDFLERKAGCCCCLVPAVVHHLHNEHCHYWSSRSDIIYQKPTFSTRSVRPAKMMSSLSTVTVLGDALLRTKPTSAVARHSQL